jgi:hypothetical protein
MSNRSIKSIKYHVIPSFFVIFSFSFSFTDGYQSNRAASRENLFDPHLFIEVFGQFE